MNKILDELHQIIYKIDASHLNVDASGYNIFIPENKNEVIEILQNAIDNNKKIIIRGSGTNLVGNCLPISNSYVLDMSKLNKIYELNNDSITIDPGVVCDDLNVFLNDKNLFFPVIPGSHAVAQIGAMIATNASGMRAIKYGKMEDWVNWIEVIIIDKESKIKEIKLDKENIKDFLNSEGILGVITKINLKLTQRTQQTSIDFIKFDNLDDLLNKTLEYKNNKLELNISALEFIDKKVSDFLKIDSGYYLLVEFENLNGSIKDKNEIKKIWEIRDSCYSVVVSNGYELIEDPEINLEQIKKMIIWLEENNIPTFGHIGTGILHPHYNKSQKDLIKQMYSLVKELDGKVSGEHGIGIKKKEFLDNLNKEYFIKLKKEYNPNNIFGGNNITN